jgi:uncharacterized protein with HEPN domain
MSKRTPDLLLEDILDSARKIQKFTKGMSFEAFLDDERTSDAVIRNFEVIGEASNRLPDEFKSNITEINWVRIRGFRNRIVHDYFGIDHSIVWKIVQSYIPELIKSINKVKKRKN